MTEAKLNKSGDNASEVARESDRMTAAPDFEIIGTIDDLALGGGSTLSDAGGPTACPASCGTITL